MKKYRKPLVALAIAVMASFALAASASAHWTHPFTLKYAKAQVQRIERQTFRHFHIASLTPIVRSCRWDGPFTAVCTLHGPSLITPGSHTFELRYGIAAY